MQISPISRTNFGVRKTDNYKKAELVLGHFALRGSRWNPDLLDNVLNLIHEIKPLLPNSTLDYKGKILEGRFFLYNAPNGKSYDIGYTNLANPFESLKNLLRILKLFQAGETIIEGCKQLEWNSNIIIYNIFKILILFPKNLTTK